MRVMRPQRIWLAAVISGVFAHPVSAQQAQPPAPHQHAPAAKAAARAQEPSALDALRKRFDELLARTSTGSRRLDAKRKAQMFDEFLAWPKNPFEIELTVTRTWADGGAQFLGTIAIRNSEIMVAGRKEVALFIKPTLRSLSPGRYAFHVHENPDCGPAIKDGQLVPGLAAGNHLWLSGTGAMSGTTFTSHLGDLPDLEVEADGTARKEVVAARLTLADVVNRSFIIHASQDDTSPRMACALLK